MNSKVFKLGLDVHGVISQHPEIFAPLSVALTEAGHEVHIITGKEITEEFTDWLKQLGMSWSHIFSITEELRDRGEDVQYKDADNPVFDNEEAWDRAKAEYCERESISLHIDDSARYLSFFTTPAALFQATNCYLPSQKKIEQSSE